jgi:hypothetical protein
MASDIGGGQAAGKLKRHCDFGGPDIDSIICKETRILVSPFSTRLMFCHADSAYLTCADAMPVGLDYARRVMI